MLSALAGAVVLAATAASARAGQTQDTAFHSRALAGTVRFQVALPADYATSGRRYPVIYFLHGLPSGEDAYRGAGFVAHALAAAKRQAILVAPQGARAGETDPEYLDRGPGRRWATAIADELPRVVDARYRTIRSRRGRALIGLSAGGYGAMHLAFQRLDRFSVVESWSGYFHPTNPSGTQPLDLGTDRDNHDADVHRQALRQIAALRRLPTFVGFYVGAEDVRFAAENRQLHRELTRLRVPHVFRVYGGGHDQRLWSRNASAWLGLALSHLAPAA